MKRYDLSAECSKCGSITKDLTESPIGDWILHEDIIQLKDELKFYKRQIARLEEQISAMKKTIVVTSEYWNDR